MQKTGVLIVNLGTPQSPSPRAVKRYLTQFLSDKRVIDLPYFFRQFLVRGVIIPKRYRESAKMYASIWTAQGSPLKIYGLEVAKKLNLYLGDGFDVQLAMRYQEPSIASVLEKLKGHERLIILPLFPQYASATTGSIYQEIFRVIQKWEVIPSLSCVNEFATHEKVIDAFCAAAKTFDLENYDHVLFSYHGLPEKQIKKADSCGRCLNVKDCCATLDQSNHFCYAAQCRATTAALSHKLKLPDEKISHSYQSRLGKDPWLKPYTSAVLQKLAEQNKKKILVFCPAFVADCLETLQEIQIEYKADFQRFGGEQLDLVPGLNARKEWIEALAYLVHENTLQEVGL